MRHQSSMTHVTVGGRVGAVAGAVEVDLAWVAKSHACNSGCKLVVWSDRNINVHRQRVWLATVYVRLRKVNDRSLHVYKSGLLRASGLGYGPEPVPASI